MVATCTSGSVCSNVTIRLQIIEAINVQTSEKIDLVTGSTRVDANHSSRDSTSGRQSPNFVGHVAEGQVPLPHPSTRRIRKTNSISWLAHGSQLPRDDTGQDFHFIAGHRPDSLDDHAAEGYQGDRSAPANGRNADVSVRKAAETSKSASRQGTGKGKLIIIVTLQDVPRPRGDL